MGGGMGAMGGAAMGGNMNQKVDLGNLYPTMGNMPG
jgi:hypothetical protein